MTDHVFYRKDSLDGFAASYCHYLIKDKQQGDSIYSPLVRNEIPDPDVCHDCDVYLFGLSQLSPDTLSQIAAVAHSVTVIDHRQDLRDRLSPSVSFPNVRLFFDTKKSTSFLAFSLFEEWFGIDKQPLPASFMLFLHRIQVAELGLETANFNNQVIASLQSRPFGFSQFRKILSIPTELFLETLQRDGQAILRNQEKWIDDLLADNLSRIGNMVAVNSSTMIPEIGFDLACRYDYGVVFSIRADAVDFFVFSLGEESASDIAKQYSGDNSDCNGYTSSFSLPLREGLSLISKANDPANPGTSMATGDRAEPNRPLPADMSGLPPVEWLIGGRTANWSQP